MTDTILRPRLKINTYQNNMPELYEGISLISRNYSDTSKQNYKIYETYFRYQTHIHKLYVYLKSVDMHDIACKITLNRFTENGYMPLYHIEISNKNNKNVTDMVIVDLIIGMFNARKIEYEKLEYVDIHLINELCENFYNKKVQ